VRDCACVHSFLSLFKTGSSPVFQTNRWYKLYKKKELQATQATPSRFPRVPLHASVAARESVVSTPPHFPRVPLHASFAASFAFFGEDNNAASATFAAFAPALFPAPPPLLLKHAPSMFPAKDDAQCVPTCQHHCVMKYSYPVAAPQTETQEFLKRHTLKMHTLNLNLKRHTLNLKKAHFETQD
jgi:hypothetical protein